MRVHKFGDEDGKKSLSTMMDFASKDDNVKLLMTEERIAIASQEFDEQEDWNKQLKYATRSNVLENSVWNLNLILQNDPDFAGFAYNELASRIQIIGELPWERPEGNLYWRDADTAQLKSLIDARYLPFSSRNHDDCVHRRLPMTVTSILFGTTWTLCLLGTARSAWKTCSSAT